MSDRQLEVAMRLLDRILAKDDPSLWAGQVYKAHALELFEECADKVRVLSGETADMTLIVQTIERPAEWGK